MKIPNSRIDQIKNELHAEAEANRHWHLIEAKELMGLLDEIQLRRSVEQGDIGLAGWNGKRSTD